MPEGEWPLTVRLNPAVLGLDSLVVPPPKNDNLGFNNPRLTQRELSRDFRHQQNQLIDDAMCILNGGEGDFIKFVETFDPEVLDDKLVGPHYKLPHALDPSLRDVTTRITEIAGSAYAVRTFADHFGGLEYGRVNQALSSAFRMLHRLFLSHLAKIEAHSYKSSAEAGEERSLYTIWVKLEPFAAYLANSRSLVVKFMEETRLARDRKRRHGALDLVERASTAQFVAHDEKEAVIELRGGAVLRSIAELMRREMGDSEVSNLYEEFLAASSKPYLKMFEKWITRGELDDPFEEFLIQETQAFNSGSYVAGASEENVDDYWDKRYAVRAMVLPLQLSSPNVYNMLLVSGKYLNVIRDASSKPSTTDSPREESPLRLNLDRCRSIEDSRVLEAVVEAYKYANRTLIQVFHSPPIYNLKGLLSKLQEVFFLYNTELYDSFVSNARSELQKPLSRVSLAKLEYALALAKDPDDPWNQYIGVTLSSEPLKEALLSVVASSEVTEETNSQKNENKHSDSKLTGLDVVQFDFSVPFPLNVVISRRSIMRYQFLFRHHIELKAVHDDLSRSWVAHVKDPRWKVPFSHSTEPNDAIHCIRRASLLRQRKIQLITDLIYHSTVDGIQHEHNTFLQNMDSIDEVSELVDAHIRFLDRALMNCLLSDPQLLKIQARLLSLCRQYSKFLDSNADTIVYFTNPDPDNLMTDEAGNEISPEDLLSWFSQTLDRYEHSFNRNIQKFNDQLENFMPNNFVAGAATLYLIQSLKPLLAS